MIAEEIKKIDERIHSQEGGIDAIYASVDWIGITLKICKEHGFNEQDAEEITREVGYMLLGMSPAEEFENQIKSRTQLTDASVKLLMKDISNEVLAPLEDGARVFEEMTETTLKKIREESRNYESDEPKKHILVVPVKGKTGETVEQTTGPHVPVKKKVDPYREPIG